MSKTDILAEDKKEFEAMQDMNLWQLEKDAKSLPQIELKQLIDNLTDFYQGRYGRLFK